MSSKLVYFLLAVALCIAPAMHGANIIWVSGDHDDNADGTPDDIGWVEFLRASGHDVAFEPGGPWEDLDEDEIAQLNDADLIIFSRDSGSGAYDDGDEIATWNGINTPLILMNVYLCRSSRWLWIDGTSLNADSGTPTLEAIDIHHPIFNEVDLDTAGKVDIYDQGVGSATVSLYSGTDMGNGTLVAKADGADWTVIAEWEPGVEFYSGSGQTPAARRMFFGAGTREGNGQGRGEYNLNAEGEMLFLNMVDYMTGVLVREPWVKAWEPDPADGARNVALPLLRWTPGDTALLHNVYFGTSPELTEADLAAARIPQTLYFHPLPLEPGTTYYWRVDEIDSDDTVHEGDVWSFSVAPLTAYDPLPRDGAKWIDPAGAALEWLPGKDVVSHDVYFGTDETAVAEGTGDTFKGNQPGNRFDLGDLEDATTYYWRIDEITGDGTKRTGELWSFETVGEGGGLRGTYYNNTAVSGEPALRRVDPQINFNWGDDAPEGLINDSFSVRWSGELDVPFSETYTFYPNTEDGVRLWVDGVELLDLWQNRRSPTEVKASIELEGGRRYPITMEFYDAGGVAVAELRWESPSIPKGLIPQPAFSLPLRASSPEPQNASVNVRQDSVLTWSVGEMAAEHDVYFGTDANAVATATRADSVYQGRQSLEETTFDPGALDWNTTYYWRIDEVNDLDADSPWTGSVWSFTTADFLIVDDFEDYTDNQDDGEAIFQTWIDGFGDDSNGSTVGYLESDGGTFGETKIVHSGDQSMPFDYNNVGSPSSSEAFREFSPAQDWTVNGVSNLTIWYRGSSSNSPEGFYVIVEDGAGGTATEVHPDPAALNAFDWAEWTIPLDELASLNLTRVAKLTIGVGDPDNPGPGGAGLLMIDDIRVTKPAPVEEPAGE